MFAVFYKFICGHDYEAKIKEEQFKKAEQAVKASTESVFALAENLNKKKHGTDSDEGIYSSKSDAMQSEEESEVVIKKDQPKKKSQKKKRNKEMTFLNKTSEDEDKHDSSE